MFARKRAGKILVIDDDPNVLKIVELMLKQDGHRVTTAINWEAVVEKLKGVAVGAKPFDIIFLDLLMPGRSGFDVFRSLQLLLYPMPPVIILTALNDLENAIDALQLGAKKYLTKPIDPQKLLRSVQELLAGVEGSRF